MLELLAQSMSAGSGSTRNAGIPIALMAAIYAAALGFVIIGAWFVWGGRHVREDAAPGAAARWRNNLTLPTRSAIGLALMVLGYHFAAWISPYQWRILHVPREYWWVVVGAAVVAIVASLLMDRLEEQSGS